MFAIGDEVVVTTERWGIQKGLVGIVYRFVKPSKSIDLLNVGVNFPPKQKGYFYALTNSYHSSDLELTFKELPYDPAQAGDEEDDI